MPDSEEGSTCGDEAKPRLVNKWTKEGRIRTCRVVVAPGEEEIGMQVLCCGTGKLGALRQEGEVTSSAAHPEAEEVTYSKVSSTGDSNKSMEEGHLDGEAREAPYIDYCL